MGLSRSRPRRMEFKSPFSRDPFSFSFFSSERGRGKKAIALIQSLAGRTEEGRHTTGRRCWMDDALCQFRLFAMGNGGRGRSPGIQTRLRDQLYPLLTGREIFAL